jgi:hypothetical protein
VKVSEMQVTAAYQRQHEEKKTQTADPQERDRDRTHGVRASPRWAGSTERSAPEIRG